MRTKFRMISCLLFALVFSSCQKDVVPEDEEIEETFNRLPKQIIYSETADNFSEVWSIKYDMLNRSINIYYEDTTNAVLYDRIKESYQYNSDGYLVKYESHGYTGESEQTDIVRNTNNQINYIIYSQGFNALADTFFYTYQKNGDELNIKVVKGKEPLPGVMEDRERTYTYNTDLQLTSIFHHSSEESTEFRYSRGKFVREFYEDNESFNEALVSYASGDQAAKQDSLMQLVLGKDYYIQGIRDMYFFQLFSSNGFFMLSCSDPNLPSRLESRGNNSFDGEYNEVRNYSFDLNQKGLPVKITASYLDETSIFQIRY